MTAPFTVEREGEVELLTLGSTGCLTMLDQQSIAALHTYFLGLPDREDVRVVLLAGAGRGFCAGLDLAAWQAVLAEGSGREILTLQEEASGMIRAMRAAPQPLVGLGHGAAVGLGFALLLACDVRIGSPSLAMSVASVRIGLSGADVGISYFLPRIVGSALAAELMLTGRMIEAAEARAAGLLSDVVPEDALRERGHSVAAQIAANAPLGIRFTKQALDAAPATLAAAVAIEDRQQVLLALTADHREAVEAFLAKRQPRFIGR